MSVTLIPPWFTSTRFPALITATTMPIHRKYNFFDQEIFCGLLKMSLYKKSKDLKLMFYLVLNNTKKIAANESTQCHGKKALPLSPRPLHISFGSCRFLRKFTRHS